MYINIIKPAFDRVLGIIIFMIMIPVLIGFSITGFIVYRGNPFFLQTRAGKDGNAFKIIKFRSMTGSEADDCDDLDRVNWYGKLIRRLNIDELPQLINVIMGDMSLIGPRPLYIQYIELYDSNQARRLILKPGITGWAQVNGRNAISWEQRFNLDVWYVDNCTFILDAKIVALTLMKAFIRINAENDDYQPIKPFTGSHKDE